VGHKVHPVGFRLGVTRTWDARWYANNRDYPRLLAEDLDIRAMLRQRLANASVSRIEIERTVNQVSVTIHTAKPGIVIGKGGQAVEELRKALEQLTGKRVRLNIVEITRPELDATLVARNIAEQLEKRVAFRRAMRQAVQRAMRLGARGIKIVVGGRLGGAEMARREKDSEGKVPLQTIRADIDYGQAEALTTYGRIGVKVWIYKGDILPDGMREQVAAPPRERAPREVREGREPRETRRRRGGRGTRAAATTAETTTAP